LHRRRGDPLLPLRRLLPALAAADRPGRGRVAGAVSRPACRDVSRPLRPPLSIGRRAPPATGARRRLRLPDLRGRPGRLCCARGATAGLPRLGRQPLAARMPRWAGGALRGQRLARADPYVRRTGCRDVRAAFAAAAAAAARWLRPCIRLRAPRPSPSALREELWEFHHLPERGPAASLRAQLNSG